MSLRMRDLGVCLVVILLPTVWETHAANEEEFVVTLDHSNFTDFVAKHDFILVEFYAPWCGHCIKLAPEFEKAASVLSRHDPAITLAKIDASDETVTDIAAQYQVQGFPTLKILRNRGSTIQEYKGPRDADGIVHYLKKQLGPVSAEIKYKDDASNIIDEKRIFIAGVFTNLSGEEYENFTKLAKKLRSDYDFGHTLDAKLLPKGDTSAEGPFIRLLKPFDELFADFKNFDLDAMEKFIKTEDSPSVVVFDMDPRNSHLGKFFQSEKTKVSLILNFSSENAAGLKSKFQDIAYLLKGGDFSFLMGDVESSKPLLQHFKLEASQAPLIFVQKSGDEKYLKANVEPDQLVQWFKKVKDGKVETFKASQPIPKENNDPVKVVVLDTLHDFVFNSSKEVLLEFYAPWCGYCKNLAPTLNELAVSYEKDPNILIAKFDATANDVPRELFNVQGYPSLYFVKSNNEIVEYTGGQSKEDFIEFIEKYRSDNINKGQAEIQSEPAKKNQT